MKGNLKGQLRGQAAMEYLMTYGWALFMIVVVIAALLYLNPFKMPEMCVFQQPGFSCGESAPQVFLENNEVYVSLRLYNQFGKTVNLEGHKVACTTASIGDVDKDTVGKSPTDIGGSDVKNIGAGSSKVLKTQCVDANGNPITITPGSQFKGIYIVWYNFDDDPDPTVHREAVANLVSTVVEKK